MMKILILFTLAFATGFAKSPCGRPPRAENAKVSLKRKWYGSEAVYRCNPGYRQVGGGNVLHCPWILGEWKGTLPVCLRKCVRKCRGVPDGDYQSCKGCNVYVTCSNGDKYDRRPCPADLVWDDISKRCEWTSRTCGRSPPKPTCGPCVRNCRNKPDGDYQSCKGCNVYVTCSNGLTYDKRPCPADLVWDDKVKECRYRSTTCCSRTKDDKDGIGN